MHPAGKQADVAPERVAVVGRGRHVRVLVWVLGAVGPGAGRRGGCDTRPQPAAAGSRITIGMPRSAAQSDFVVTPAPPVEDDELVGAPIGVGTAPVELPRARLRTRFASARATRVVMTFTFIVLAALMLLTVIGPHIPAGE